MTPERIAELAGAGESEVLEFKKSTAALDAAMKAVCAMLNHRGGRVLFGVTPDAGVVGQGVGERTVERIAERMRDIEPPAFPSIERVPVGHGHEVLAISVGIGQSRPYT